MHSIIVHIATLKLNVVNSAVLYLVMSDTRIFAVIEVRLVLYFLSLTAADRDVDKTELKQLLDNKDLQDNTVLHMAALNNDVKTAELCLDHGADVNTRKSKETTPLHMAATKGNLEMVELLISRGADVNMKDGDSKAPLHWYELLKGTKIYSRL